MVIYHTQDLIFATKIRGTAEALGIASRPVRDLESLQKRLDGVDDGKVHESVTALLLDLEAGDASLELLDRVKQHAPGVPVVAFGSHVATELLHAARDRGAHFVMPRSQFSANLPTILQRFGGKDF